MERTRQATQCGRAIIEQAMQVRAGKGQGSHPTVLSCGGIFVPRPRPINPRDPLYHILNTPHEVSPVKVVSALMHRNLLQEVLAKESLN